MTLRQQQVALRASRMLKARLQVMPLVRLQKQPRRLPVKKYWQAAQPVLPNHMRKQVTCQPLAKPVQPQMQLLAKRLPNKQLQKALIAKRWLLRVLLVRQHQQQVALRASQVVRMQLPRQLLKRHRLLPMHSLRRMMLKVWLMSHQVRRLQRPIKLKLPQTVRVLLIRLLTKHKKLHKEHR